ncbi:hypothetical protein TrLO_g11627 [Triparma laevis f. longispina]|uniref:Transaldolase n=1 Tax=Triparma laevis f. longispina TaxID=1714387 RepID=A0A9W7FR87_9STRA|nr:hypothetical protein TrLO_g11627 [Triparma laevis f. longispina]
MINALRTLTILLLTTLLTTTRAFLPRLSLTPHYRTMKKHATSSRSSLADLTTIVADTGDINAIKKYQPTDATTNPSLIYKAMLLPEYSDLVSSAIIHTKSLKSSTPVSDCLDYLSVKIGTQISTIVPGYVSTEVDARLSFDTDATVEKARKLIKLYEEEGVDKSRILVKIASTWEGIKAAEILQKEGITCNLTLLFSMSQAVACADAKVTLISPFVGRIMDWYKKSQGVSSFSPSEDPGVMSVTDIYNYYKKFEIDTIVMGASFRNVGEILELAGCDRLTISPSLLEELENTPTPVTRKLDSKLSESRYSGEKIEVDEKKFRYMMNEDAMATEKLAEGIRGFIKDIEKCEEVIRKGL